MNLPDVVATRGSSPWFRWSLGLILLLGTALRLGYIEHKIYHVDEQIALGVIKSLDFPRQWDTDLAKSDPSSRFSHDHYNFSSYHYSLYLWKCLLSAIGVDWVNHIGALRALNGLFGLIFIWAVALATRRAVGEIAGIATASAGAIMPLLIEDAHYLRCEAMLTAGLALLVWIGTRSGSTSRWISFSSGFILGWMMACKATMGLAAPLLLLILINATISKHGSWRLMLILAGTIGLGLAVGVTLGVPWGVAQPQVYLSGLTALAGHYRTPMPPLTSPNMDPSIGALLHYMKGTLGWGFWAVTTLGVIKMFKLTGWWRTLLIASPVVAALILFGGHALFTERSYSPFLPVIVMFFGAGTQFAIEWIIRLKTNLEKYSSLLTTVSLLITLALPAIYSWQLVFKIFSGEERIERKAMLDAMRGNLTGKRIAIINIPSYPEYFRDIAAAVESNEPVLVVVFDYNDPITPNCLATLQQKFNGRVLGVYEGIFPGLPPCYLNSILSPTLWMLYIPSKTNGG